MTAKRRSEWAAIALTLIAVALGAGWLIRQMVLDCALGAAMDQWVTGTVVRLLNQGAGVNVASPQRGTTPLIFLLNFRRDPKLVKMLLVRKANVNAQDNRGEFPLMTASSLMPLEEPVLIEELLRRGAQVNQGGGSLTALMVASMTGSTKAVEVLLKHGADPNLLSRHGDTALAMAQGKEVVLLLQKAGGTK